MPASDSAVRNSLINAYVYGLLTHMQFAVQPAPVHVPLGLYSCCHRLLSTLSTLISLHKHVGGESYGWQLPILRLQALEVTYPTIPH